jgi:hypothetical protein
MLQRHSSAYGSHLILDQEHAFMIVDQNLLHMNSKLRRYQDRCLQSIAHQHS